MSSRETVRKEILKANIEIRGKSHHHGNPSLAKYGQRLIKEKLVKNKTEQRTIDAVR